MRLNMKNKNYNDFRYFPKKIRFQPFPRKIQLCIFRKPRRSESRDFIE